MRYNEITDIDLIDEDWKKKALGGLTAAGIALGAGGIGSNIASSMMSNPDSIERSYDDGGAADLLNKIENGHYRAGKKANGTHQNYPDELLGLQGDELKDAFVHKVVPLIKQCNDDIKRERNHIIKISLKDHKTDEDMNFIKSEMKTYKVDNIKDLIKAVDIIPVPMALAQAGVESGWGTSRFAKEANALFGQKTVAKTNIKSQTDQYAVYDSFKESIASYMHNLNTHPAYEKFRDERYSMRRSGNGFNIKELVNTLLHYSTRGKDYVHQVKQIMSDNGFDSLG